jgi:hypothetical protein
MSSGLSTLNDVEISEIENFFDTNIGTLKNSILEAIDINNITNNSNNNNNSSNINNSVDIDNRVVRKMSKTEVYLDILECLWLTQALKERHFDSWFSDLRILQSNEVCFLCFMFYVNDFIFYTYYLLNDSYN